MEDMKRTLPPKKSSLRKELECTVLSVNKFLKDVVDSMNYILLLRNMHPYLREFYARKLYEKELITIVEAQEFYRFK